MYCGNYSSYHAWRTELCTLYYHNLNIRRSMIDQKNTLSLNTILQQNRYTKLAFIEYLKKTMTA